MIFPANCQVNSQIFSCFRVLRGPPPQGFAQKMETPAYTIIKSGLNVMFCLKSGRNFAIMKNRIFCGLPSDRLRPHDYCNRNACHSQWASVRPPGLYRARAPGGAVRECLRAGFRQLRFLMAGFLWLVRKLSHSVAFPDSLLYLNQNRLFQLFYTVFLCCFHKIFKNRTIRRSFQQWNPLCRCLIW